MTSSAPNLPAWWAGLILEELRRRGLRHIVISPGSRSSPLTVQAARQRQFTTHIAYDERAAAYFALGIGRSQDVPAALICTSGTAVANYWPAVVEASQDNVPLIVISADRPQELWGSGANQTIRQDQIFGQYARYAVTLPEPIATGGQVALGETAKSWLAATWPRNPGPVHLNTPLIEPLDPVGPAFTSTDDPVIAWLGSGQPWPAELPPHNPALPIKTTSALSTLNAEHPTEPTFVAEDIFLQKFSEAASLGTGLVVGGRIPLAQRKKITSIVAQWPTVALGDIQSGWNGDWIVKADIDNLIDNNSLQGFSLHWILQVGALGLSKHLPTWVAQQNCPIFCLQAGDLLNTHPHTPATRLMAGWPDIGRVLKLLGPKVQEHGSSQEPHRPLLAGAAKTKSAIAHFGKHEIELSEILAAIRLGELWPEEWPLLVGNSMPVRSLSLAASGVGLEKICANRGASGIDGNIATACGLAQAEGKPTAVFIGDLTALHDLNSLLMASRSLTPIIVVIVNNYGGGIFRHLPIAQHTDVFRDFFTTPHKLTFEYGARMFDLPYSCPNSNEAFAAELKAFIDRPKSRLIEIQIDQEANYTAYRRLKETISDRLER